MTLRPACCSVLSAAILLFLFNSPAWAISKKRVALFQIIAVNTSEVYAQKMFSELQSALTTSKKLTLVSEKKEELTRKIEEMKKAGCTEAECLTNAGIELDVQKVLSGELRQMPEGYFELDLRMVDVLSAEYEYAYETIKGETVADLKIMAAKAVDMIDSKIIIEPTIQSVGTDGTVIIDAGSDLGMKRDMRFSVIRVAKVQKDGKGKIIFRQEDTVGVIELELIQPLGSRARIISENKPVEVGDIAHVAAVVDEIDEPPKIIHSSVRASVQGRDILIQANIVDDKKVESASLWYRSGSEEKMRSLPMVNSEKDKFVATIPAASVSGTSVAYYISATDSKGQVTEKKEDSKNPFSIMIIRDNEPPELEHTPLTEVNSSDRIMMRAIVRDNVKVSKVLAFYKKREDEAYQSKEMIWFGGNAYAVVLPENTTLNTKSVQYYLTATDQAENTGTCGSLAKPFEIKVITQDLSGPQVAHSPVKTFESGRPITIEAQITDPSGVRRALVYAKPENEAQYRAFEMTRGDAGLFHLRLDRSLPQIGSSKILYYIWSGDSLGNSVTFGSSETPNVMFPKAVEPILGAKLNADETPPCVSHFPPKFTVKGMGYPMQVNVDDESGIGSVVLYSRGPSEKEYQQMQLRGFAPGCYGDFISSDRSPLSYYIEVKDSYENITRVGSAGDPIVIVPGEILSGKYRYIVGSSPDIPPLEIGFLAPSELAELGFSDYERWSWQSGYSVRVEIKSSGPIYHIEGVIQSTRECDVVIVDTVRAEILPLSAEELQVIPRSTRSTKFVADIPTPVDGAIVLFHATDILGKRIILRLAIRNAGRKAPKPLVEQKSKISVSHPMVNDDVQSVAVVGISGSINLSGKIAWPQPVQRVTINGIAAAIRKLSDQETQFESTIPIADGENRVAIKAWSAKGDTLSRNITISASNVVGKPPDQIPPEIEIASPHINQATNIASILLRARITDNVKVESVHVFVGGEEATNIRLKREGETVVLIEDTLALKQGKNTLRVTASDGRQQVSKTIDVMYRIPSPRPTIFVVSPIGEIATENSIALFFNVTGYRSGMKVRIALNGATVHEDLAEGRSIVVGQTQPVEFSTLMKMRLGQNRILITVFDNEDTVRFEKKVIYGMPTLTILAPTDTVVSKSKIEARIKATNIANEESIEISVNGKKMDAIRGFKNTQIEGNPLEYHRTISLELGLNRIEILARNEAGTASAVLTVRLKEPLIPNDQFHALIIGVQEYSDPKVGNLDNPIRDAKRLMDVLIEDYTFDKQHTVLLENPNRETILASLDRLANTLQPSDNLLIFYAGHGFWDEKSEQGYWWPSDMTLNSKSKWISNSDIRDAIKSLSARHVLLIADACFGGSIFKTRGRPTTVTAINKLYEKPSRKAMTSGNMTETPDESKFLYYLTKSLKENKEIYISSDNLFYDFRDAVVANSATVPQYGTIHEAKDEGGEFIFVKKDH